MTLANIGISKEKRTLLKLKCLFLFSVYNINIIIVQSIFCYSIIEAFLSLKKIRIQVNTSVFNLAPSVSTECVLQTQSYTVNEKKVNDKDN